MKRLALMVLSLLVVFVSSVYATDLTVDMNPTSLSGEPGETLSFYLMFSGADELPESTFLDVGLADSSDIDLTVLSPPRIQFLMDLRDVWIRFEFTIPEDVTPGAYPILLKVSEEGGSHNVPRPFILTVEDPATPPPTDTRSVSLTRVQGDMNSIVLESGEDENILTLRLQNTGTETLNNVAVTTSFETLEDDDGDEIHRARSSSSIASLAPNATADVEFEFDVESGFDSDQLQFNFITTAYSGFSQNTQATFVVRPVACQPDAEEQNLRVSIERPDSSDDFERGDTFSVELEVENDGDDDIDAKIVAVLYNNDKNRREDTVTLTRDVNEDDTETVEFEMNIGDSVDDGDSLTLFAKAYDDDDDLDCAMDDVDLDVEVPDHKVNVEDVLLNPSTVSCNRQVSGSALLNNVGSHDEDVIFDVYNAQLGASASSPLFELEEETERPVNFVFEVPEDAQPGAYQIFLRASYSGDEKTITVSTLNVVECQTVDELTAEETATADVNQLTGAATADIVKYEDKSLFDVFNKPSGNTPTSVWVLVDVLLVLLILGTLVWLFRSRR